MKLSIIIPVINECDVLQGLFAALAGQRGVDFDVLLIDGGSHDGTFEQAQALAPSQPYPLSVLAAPRGRAQQLNFGVKRAGGDLLLFLHADSLFATPDALAKGVALLTNAATAQQPAAARFALCFRRSDVNSAAFGYYFHESKARLDRPGCIHGDQGLLLTRATFAAAGPFDHALPLAEDTVFADRVRSLCGWQLIPADLYTSARRFEREGLQARQTLNALLLNFVAIDWQAFFAAAPGVYRLQGETARLDLRPWWQLIESLLAAMSRKKRWQLLWQTGRYVRGNAWQLAFYLDVRSHYRHKRPVAEGTFVWLGMFDRYCAPLLNNPVATLAAAVLTRGWFIVTGWRLGRRR